MDRNYVFAGGALAGSVALRKESVDRNVVLMLQKAISTVALRKESVDRNIPCSQLPTPEPPSLSARRAWIEIETPQTNSQTRTVALRKESVDRNAEDWLNAGCLPRRSPQGERG